MDDSWKISLLRNRDAAAQRRHSASSPQQWTGVQLSWMAIRCIRLLVGRPTRSLRRRFSNLYDPTRSKRFVRDGKTTKREDFDAYLEDLRNKLLADHGDSVAFLVEETNSPTRERLRGELEKIFRVCAGVFTSRY